MQTENTTPPYIVELRARLKRERMEAQAKIVRDAQSGICSLIAHFDGACEPKNPGGHGACACLIEMDGVDVYRKSEYLGFGAGMTNNVAEYRGLLLILNWFIHYEPKERLHIVGDSQIVIRRMNGQSRKPPTGLCAKLAENCLLVAFPHRNWLSFEWQRREKNEECDAMCQLEIEEEIARLRNC